MRQRGKFEMAGRMQNQAQTALEGAFMPG